MTKEACAFKIVLVLIATLGLIITNFVAIYYINVSTKYIDEIDVIYISDSKFRTIVISILVSIVNKFIVILVEYLGKYFIIYTYIKYITILQQVHLNLIHIQM